MAYCLPADVKVYVGTVVSDADLTAMIADADRTIDLVFEAAEITVDSSCAKAASILLVRSSVAERFYLTGENPTSYTAGDYSQSETANQSALAASLKMEAKAILDKCIRSAETKVSNLVDFKRSDSTMTGLQLDCGEVPLYWET